MDFAQLCADAGYAVRPYSGRGMEGRYCLGIVLDTTNALVADLIAAACPDDKDALAGVLRRMRTDSMGRSIVAYFPNVPAPNDQPGDQEDE